MSRVCLCASTINAFSRCGPMARGVRLNGHQYWLILYPEHGSTGLHHLHREFRSHERSYAATQVDPQRQTTCHGSCGENFRLSSCLIVVDSIRSYHIININIIDKSRLLDMMEIISISGNHWLNEFLFYTYKKSIIYLDESDDGLRGREG